ncbi:carbonic anhydrase [Clostridium lundense]|uniref:carbonic anhydrase n=1 Tax=Clostridium lundense TaxID=319475 RepID=UPI001FA7FDCF|nr:carbonic anhydrase [Clostridium lundense]
MGHYDCAANPVSDCEHFWDIAVSTCRIKSWGLPVRVVGLWVDKFGHVHVVSR